MAESLQIIVSLLAAIGVGSVFGAYFQSLFQHQKQIKEASKIRMYSHTDAYKT